MWRVGGNKRRNRDEKAILRERKELDNGKMCDREGEIL